MNRDEYRQLTNSLLDQAHDLSMALFAAAKLMPGTDSAEYADLSQAANIVSIAADILYRTRYPQPSALTEGEPANA